MPLVFGYARVRTDRQTHKAQVAQLEAAEKVFCEKVSGAVRSRLQLVRLLSSLSPNDVVPITRLDRLTWSTRDRLNVLIALAGWNAAFCSPSDTWANTTAHGGLMLTMLASLAA